MLVVLVVIQNILADSGMRKSYKFREAGKSDSARKPGVIPSHLFLSEMSGLGCLALYGNDALKQDENLFALGRVRSQQIERVNRPCSTNQSEVTRRSNKNYVKGVPQRSETAVETGIADPDLRWTSDGSPSQGRQFRSSVRTIGPTQSEESLKKRKQVFGTRSNRPGNTRLDRTWISRERGLWKNNINNRHHLSCCNVRHCHVYASGTGLCHKNQCRFCVLQYFLVIHMLYHGLTNFHLWWMICFGMIGKPCETIGIQRRLRTLLRNVMNLLKCECVFLMCTVPWIFSELLVANKTQVWGFFHLTVRNILVNSSHVFGVCQVQCISLLARYPNTPVWCFCAKLECGDAVACFRTNERLVRPYQA